MFQFYFCILLLFIFDTILRGFLQQKIVYTVLCFYSIAIFYNRTLTQLLFLGLFLMLDAFLATQASILSLIYLIPVTYLAITARSVLQPHTNLPVYGMFMIVIGSQALLDVWLYQKPLIEFCTFHRLWVNMIILYIFLKFFVTDRSGNRFYDS